MATVYTESKRKDKPKKLLGAVHKLCRLKGGGEGQKLPNLPSKKTTKRGGGGQKSPILR